MRQVNIHEAKTHLSRLVDQASKGEAFVIAKAGKPLVKVVPIGAEAVPDRLGWLGSLRHEGWTVPDTVEAFNRDDEEIAHLFEGDGD